MTASTVDQGERQVAEALGRTQAAVDSVLRRVMGDLPPVMRRIGGYHPRWEGQAWRAAAGIETVGRMDGLDILHRSVRRPLDVLLIPLGPLAVPTLEAAALLEGEGLGVTVVDPHWERPLNSALPALAAHHRLAVTAEDGLCCGGAGTALAQACRDAAVTTPVVCLGPPHAYLPHAARGALLAESGLEGAGIARAARCALNQQAATVPFGDAPRASSTGEQQ